MEFPVHAAYGDGVRVSGMVMPPYSARRGPYAGDATPMPVPLPLHSKPGSNFAFANRVLWVRV